MTGVQLIGKKAVLESFSALECECWALFQGKQFIVSGCGADDLERWLSSFSDSGTTATYMIRVYDTDTPPTSSTACADYAACVSFKLVDAYEGLGIAGHSAGLMERIKGIEKKLDERDEQDEDEGPALDKVIMGWFTDPVKLQQVAGVIKMFMGGQPVEALPAAVQGIGAVAPNTSEPQQPVTPAVDINRLAAALDVLGAKDSKIVEHLEKLASLATNDPDLFKSVIAKLDLL